MLACAYVWKVRDTCMYVCMWMGLCVEHLFMWGRGRCEYGYGPRVHVDIDICACVGVEGGGNL